MFKSQLLDSLNKTPKELQGSQIQSASQQELKAASSEGRGQPYASAKAIEPVHDDTIISIQTPSKVGSHQPHEESAEA